MASGRANLGRTIGCVFFFFVLFLPTSYQPYKAVLLATVILGITARIASGRRLALHPTIIHITLFFVGIGLAFMLLGAFNGAPGALNVGTVYVLWPIVYLVLISGATSTGAVRPAITTAVVASIAVELYSLSYILSSRGIIPEWMYIAFDQGQDVGFYDGFTRYRIHSLTTLLFLLPLLIAVLVAWPANRPLPASRWLLWTATLLGLVLVILSGRRALIVATALAPFLAFGLRTQLPRDCRRGRTGRWVLRSVGLSALAIVAYRYASATFDVNFASLTGYFSSGFDVNAGAQGTSVRVEQYHDLTSGWKASPVFGAGLGAVAPGSVRAPESPWAYELSYVALLFHVGLVGFLAYAAGFAWVLSRGLRIVREGGRLAPDMLVTMVGAICFLVANVSNPYLEKFDYLWVIFLPVLIVNVWLLDGCNHQRLRQYASLTHRKLGTGPYVPHRRS